MEPVRIGVGNDPKSWLAGEVLKASIRRRTERPVEFIDSWTTSGWHPLLKDGPDLPMGTPFSAWRWHVPGAFGHSGRAIYLDSDQIVLADIAELFDWPLTTVQIAESPLSVDLVTGRQRQAHEVHVEYEAAGALFAAVVGAEGDILTKGKPHPDAVQTSVMVMDCSLCDWDVEDLFGNVMAGTLKPLGDRAVDPHFAEHRDPQRRSYGTLQQANWIPLSRIARLDPCWNSLNLYKPGETKLLHYTVSSQQPWRKGDRDDVTSDLWFAELAMAVLDGAVTREQVQREHSVGHVHKRVWEAVQ